MLSKGQLGETFMQKLCNTCATFFILCRCCVLQCLSFYEHRVRLVKSRTSQCFYISIELASYILPHCIRSVMFLLHRESRNVFDQSCFYYLESKFTVSISYKVLNAFEIRSKCVIDFFRSKCVIDFFRILS